MIERVITEVSDKKEYDSMKELVDKAEAAKMIGVSLPTLKYFMIKGYLHPIPTVSNKTYFRRSEVQAYKKLRAARLREKQKKSQVKDAGETKDSNA